MTCVFVGLSCFLYFTHLYEKNLNYIDMEFEKLNFVPDHVQQQMIEKIVKLQRQLARRQDKIEFLEEHVRQCTQELLKKTK